MFKVPNIHSREGGRSRLLCACVRVNVHVWLSVCVLVWKSKTGGERKRDDERQRETERLIQRGRPAGRKEGEETRERERDCLPSAGCLCVCINSAIKQTHLRKSHITAICRPVNLSRGGQVRHESRRGRRDLRRMTTHYPGRQ